MREKLFLAATITLTIYLFSSVSTSVKGPNNYLQRLLQSSTETLKAIPNDSLMPSSQGVTVAKSMIRSAG